MILLKIVLATLFMVNHGLADTTDRIFLYQIPDSEKLTPQQIQNNQEVLLEKDSLLRDMDETSGVSGNYYYTKNDQGRLSFAYHVSHDYEKLNKLQAIDFQVLKKVKSFKEHWWGLRINRVIGKYNTFADELKVSTGHPDADANSKRYDAEQSMTILGVGFGYRFKILQDFLNSDRIFETLMAYGNFIYHLDSSTETQYRGYGVSMDYGIHKRIGDSFFAGGKLSYNLASLERPKKTDEDKLDRSLVFRWTSLAFEFGYFY